MSGRHPPLHGTSDFDHGATILVSTYSWASITVVAAFSRCLLALHRRLESGYDDVSFVFAVLLAIATAVPYHLAVNAGLGRHISSLDATGVDHYFKRIYTAQLIGIAAIGCGKLSALHLSQRAFHQKARRYHTLLVIVACWTIFALLATAFQCHLPQPWMSNPSNCPTQSLLQYLISALNIVTDVLIYVWIVPQTISLKMPKDTQITVLILFGARLTTSCIIIGQMAILSLSLLSPDQTWFNVSRTLLDQAIINLSVIFATVPRVNRLLYSHKDQLVACQISKFELGEYDAQLNSKKGDLGNRQANDEIQPSNAPKSSLCWPQRSHGNDEGISDKSSENSKKRWSDYVT